MSESKTLEINWLKVGGGILSLLVGLFLFYILLSSEQGFNPTDLDDLDYLILGFGLIYSSFLCFRTCKEPVTLRTPEEKRKQLIGAVIIIGVILWATKSLWKPLLGPDESINLIEKKIEATRAFKQCKKEYPEDLSQCDELKAKKQAAHMAYMQSQRR